jgi:hypothetical protein
MAKIVNEKIVPLYKAPYPDGNEREWHGVVHALRVLIFTNIIGAMFKDAQQLSTVNVENLSYAAALHDCARENDGIDLWDAKSGQDCKAILLSAAINGSDSCPVDKQADILEQAIAQKDNPDPLSLEQKIIHDSDCIDILRCLGDVECFEAEKLWIYRELDKEMVYQFIEDAKIFIKITEDKAVKKFIESSHDPLKALHQILFHVEKLYNACPLPASYLGYSVYIFDLPGEYMLTTEIEQLIATYF